jgi:hypothetical protein
MATLHWKSGADSYQKSLSLTVDEVGVVQVTEVLICKDVAAAKGALNVAAEECPLISAGLSRPWVAGTSSDREEAGLYQVSRNFTAVLDEDILGVYKIYSAETIANREPIQTHPNFRDFAGRRFAEVNGAVFDEVGNFERFAPFITEGDMITEEKEQIRSPDDRKNRKCGITDYMMPIVHYTEVKLVFQEDLASYLEELTEIDKDLPNTDMIHRHENRTELLVKAEPEWVADRVYRLTREWAVSGPRGWDGDVYAPKSRII